MIPLLAGELDVGHRVEAQYVNPDAAARTWYPAIVHKVEAVDGVKKFTVLFIGSCSRLCACVCAIFCHSLCLPWCGVVWCGAPVRPGPALVFLEPGLLMTPSALLLFVCVCVCVCVPGYGAVQVVTSEQIRRVQAHGVRVPIPELRPGKVQGCVGRRTPGKSGAWEAGCIPATPAIPGLFPPCLPLPLQVPG